MRLSAVVSGALGSALVASRVHAYNVTECIESVQSGAWGTGRIGATDSRGRILDNVGEAQGVTYDLCVRACGGAHAPFKWSTFSSKFASWLVPWLSLVSQLPFGPRGRLNSLESVLLTLGSPTLAGYSLSLTVLNGQWISRRFSRHTYPNIRTAVRVLTSLQQSPLRVAEKDGLLASLVVLPQNDRWWNELIEWLEYPHTWSIAAFTSTIWVVAAHLLTVVNWFCGGVQPEEFGDQAIGSLWVWLLPIVTGWLLVSPTCNEDHLRRAVERVNQFAHIATDSHIIPIRHLPEQHHAINLNFDADDNLWVDERNTAPIYNYARFLPWVQSVEAVLQSFEAASAHVQRHEPVDPSVDWVRTRPEEKPHPQNRMGNRLQVERYCSAEDVLSPEKAGSLRSRWGPNILSRILVSSLLGLLLQWGTTGAAINIALNTPTTGLSCVSSSYILFGLLSTLAWIALLASSLLAHCAGTEPCRYPGRPSSTAVARWLSIALRRFGKLTAALNALWSLTTCLLQFGRFYNRCYCNSGVIGRSSFAYISAKLSESEIKLMVGAWIGGASQAVLTVIICIAFVVAYRDPPLPKEMVPLSQELELCEFRCPDCVLTDPTRTPTPPSPAEPNRYRVAGRGQL